MPGTQMAVSWFLELKTKADSQIMRSEATSLIDQSLETAHNFIGYTLTDNGAALFFKKPLSYVAARTFAYRVFKIKDVDNRSWNWCLRAFEANEEIPAVCVVSRSNKLTPRVMRRLHGKQAARNRGRLAPSNPVKPAKQTKRKGLAPSNPVKPLKKRKCTQVARMCREVKTEGWTIVRQWVPKWALDSLKDFVFKHTEMALKANGAELDSDYLALKAQKWDKTPSDWQYDGPAFGPRDKLGWQKRLGGGRLFEGSFQFEQPVVCVQELCRYLAAVLHHVSPQSLIMKPQGVTVKPPGSKEFDEHIDFGRIPDRFQIMIAATDTEFLIRPKSHEEHPDDWKEKTTYYKLLKDDLTIFSQKPCSQQVRAGDVLIIDSRLAHSSPATKKLRIVAYAHFAKDSSEC